MDITKVCKALSSKTRLKILKILVDKKLSASNIYKEYNRIYREKRRRESIYRALEKLVEAEILRKTYNDKEKEIVYELKHKELTINLLDQKILKDSEET